MELCRPQREVFQNTNKPLRNNEFANHQRWSGAIPKHYHPIFNPFSSRSHHNYDGNLYLQSNNGTKCKRRSRSDVFENYKIVNNSRNKNSWSSRDQFSSKEHSIKRGLKPMPIWHLRAFNNWAKSFLMIQGASKISGNLLVGLDLGCGQGSDLKKWFHCRVEHLYLVENNFSAMAECRRRYSYLKRTWTDFYEATHMKKEFTTDILDLPKEVDIISSQMAIHRAFESRAKAERMAYNVAHSLKCGGYFVVSVTNASRILEALKKSPGGTSFGNSVYQIQLSKPLPKTKAIPDFGIRFSFYVGSLKFEEFLVHLPILEKIMAKYGLILKESKSFLDMFFAARKIPDQVKCMQRMGIVRSGYFKNDKKKVYLTMSDEEREAASLYQALVFRKAYK